MKKIKSFFKKYQLIILLSLIAAVLGGIKFFFLPEQKEVIEQPAPTPYPTKAKEALEERGVSESEFIKDVLDKFPLAPYLPYPEKDFAVAYLAPLKLEITNKTATSAAKRQKMLDWIKSNGVDPQTHEIIWK